MLPQLKKFLDASAVPYEAIAHRIAFTAKDVARAEHIAPREHAKVTIVKLPTAFWMAVLPASKKVDLDKLATVLGEGPARLASEEEFEPMFPQCETGAMPPFGQLFGVQAVVDRALEEDESIAFQAGSHSESVRMRYADFKRLARARVADITG